MTIEEIKAVVKNCDFPNYTFIVDTDGRGEMYLRAEYWEADTETFQESKQVTRRWFLNPFQTESEITQTAFKCVITSMEHRVREWFKYKGESVYSPHFDVNALVEICRAKRFVHREK